MRRFLLLAVFVAWSVADANAQVLYGSIVGSVMDSSSAAIPGAQVKIVNAGTGKEFEVTTASEGTYAVGYACRPASTPLRFPRRDSRLPAAAR